jgi:ATP-dependent Clp protease ATP-binding subunit ClpA
MLTYQPLTQDDLVKILELLLHETVDHIGRSLGERRFSLQVPRRARGFLVAQGTSKEYGARELKRTIHRELMQPLAVFITENAIEPGSIVRVDLASGGKHLVISLPADEEAIAV